jgi:6,7-dimethyl-8-ribityllumazine synthase
MATNNSTLLQYNNLQVPNNLQVVLVYTEWNEPIVSELVNGAKRILQQFKEVSVLSVQVPGCVEITGAINMLHSKHVSLQFYKTIYIAFGCVIRGETPHFDYVCQSVTQGITLLNARSAESAPVIFGILTVNNEQEALERIGGKHGHKGEEAAIAALKMSALELKKEN